MDESYGEKDLGVWINGDMKFVEHIDKAVSKGRQILGLMKRTFRFLDSGTVKMLFTAVITSNLKYCNCNVVWHPLNGAR